MATSELIYRSNTRHESRVIAKFHYTDTGPTRTRHGHGHGLFCGETPLGPCGSVRVCVHVRVRVVEVSYNSPWRRFWKGMESLVRRICETGGVQAGCKRVTELRMLWSGESTEKDEVSGAVRGKTGIVRLVRVISVGTAFAARSVLQQRRPHFAI